MTRILSFLLSLTLIPAFAGAVTVTSKGPGTLAQTVTDPQSVTTLTVSGAIDASDLFFIAGSMPGLTALDLSAADIAAYSGDQLNGSTGYAAGLIPQMVFAGSKLTSVRFPATGSVTIGYCAFAGSDLTDLTLPDNIAAVGLGAFSACGSLTGVSLGAAALDSHVFADCAALASVTLRKPNVISASTFEGCERLARVDGSANATAIGARAFMGCSSLSAFTFGKALTLLGPEAFAFSGLRDAALADCKELDGIGDWAFARCSSLKSVELNDATANLGKGAFCDCPALDHFNLPASATEISDYAFKGDNTIDTTFLLHGDVRHIGSYAFKDLDHVTTLTIPASLESLGDYAMEGMTRLTKVDGAGLRGVPSTGTEVWRGVDQKSVIVEVDKDYYDDFKAAPQWQDFNLVAVTGVTDITAPDGGGAVSGRFVGRSLELASTGAPIDAVSLYDLNGRLVANASGLDSATAAVDTEGVEGHIFVVRVILTDGVQAVLKLAR